MLKESETIVKDISTYIGCKFKRNGREVYVTVVDEDLEKTKTVMVEFPEGRTMRLSLSTINDGSLWIPYVGEMPEPLPPEAETYVSGTEDEDPDRVRKPRKEGYTKPGPPKEYKKKKNKYKPRTKEIPEDMEYIVKNISITYNLELITNKKLPHRYLYRYKGVAIMSVYCGRHDIAISVREKVAHNMTFDDIRITHHMLGYTIHEKYENNDFYTIKMLIEQSKRYIDTEYLVHKNQIKERKTNKKEEKENG